MAALEVSRLQQESIELVEAHLKRHILESGQHGVHWLPYDPKSWNSPMTVPATSLELPTSVVGWQRWFVVKASELVVGHLSLKSSKFDRGLHRCELGMGLEHPFRGQGLGSKLMELAINEARSLDGVEYLDLRVISLNKPGIQLYTKFGFLEVSRTEDFARIDGEAVDDILMSIDVS